MLVTMVNIPCVVVPVVHSDGIAKAGESSIQLLCQNKLMTQQSVGIRKAWVHLRKTGHRMKDRCTDRQTDRKRGRSEKRKTQQRVGQG